MKIHLNDKTAIDLPKSTAWRYVVPIIVVACILTLIACTFHQKKLAASAQAVSATSTPCILISYSSRTYDCGSSDKDSAEWVQYLESQREKAIQVTARITGYSPTDSCHNPDGKGGCLAADGLAVKVGDAACPKWLALGARVKWNGGVYTCTDRTADWVQSKWIRTPTFDLYHPSCAGNVCGLTFGKIEILSD